MKSACICLLSLATMSLCLNAAGCASSGAKTTPGAPINKFCPISPTETIDPQVTTVYMSQTIGFCCADCIPMFQKEPAKYMKDLK